MTCARCKAEVPNTARFCQACGVPVGEMPATAPAPAPAAAPAAATTFSGFWRRVLAFCVDGFILSIVMMPFVIGSMFAAYGSNLSGIDLGGDPMETARELARRMQPLSFAYAVLVWLYYALMESSPKQATLGKMVVGVRVTDLEGRRLSLWRAAGRSALRYATSAFVLPLLVVAAFTPRRQAVHDLIARTFVVR